MTRPTRQRLDIALVEAGLAPSREQARRLIMAGQVRVNGQPVDKPGQAVAVDAQLEVVGERNPFVSRGGIKLEAALQAFPVDPAGRVALDVGASTGGFTDCLLQRGAKKVYAVDVGYGQFAWKLRRDPRVELWERTNIRYVTPERFGTERPELAVVDVSFISLELVLPVLFAFLPPGAPVVALIKPQFEAGPSKVGKHGVVRDPQVHLEVLTRLGRKAQEDGYQLRGLIPSPIRGPEGNIEFLAWLVRNGLPPGGTVQGSKAQAGGSCAPAGAGLSLAEWQQLASQVVAQAQVQEEQARRQRMTPQVRSPSSDPLTDSNNNRI
ncbi:MAG: TlyA family RNA methyltransferase [Limnochordaceae bacterium]|nr:TlyA family RNA methyltransferase [Limnochordaceae bacterium]